MANNALYGLLRGSQMPANINNMMQQFKAFREAYRGDARAQVQQMLNTGRISQEQYNQAVQMANALSQMMK